MITIPINKIDRPFYFAGNSNANSTAAVPWIQFTTPQVFVTLITGFLVKNLEGDPVFSFPSSCRGVDTRVVDIRVNNATIFTSLTGLDYGYPLNQTDNYKKTGQIIPVAPMAMVQFGLWDPTAGGWTYLPGYYAEMWGYILTISWKDFGEGKV